MAGSPDTGSDDLMKRRNRDYEIAVIPRYFPISEEDADALVGMIARLLVEARRREIREQLIEETRERSESTRRLKGS